MLFKALKKSNHFSYKVWLSSASISLTNYSSLDDVLADELAVRKLMTIHAAVDYLASWQTTDANIIKILNNDLCAKWITLRDYALDTLDKEYRSLMESIGKYYYGEWALMPQVPKMTSNTAPYGEVIYDGSVYYSNYPYYVFDENGTDTLGNPSAYSTTTKTNTYIGYHFTRPVIINRMSLQGHFSNSGRCPKNFKVQASNDNSTWVDIYTGWKAQDLKVEDFDFSNNTAYQYYRLFVIDIYDPSHEDIMAITTLQFYAWAPKGNVPVMTSNTAPYGEASAYQVFDGNASTTASGTDFSYKFVNPICPKDFYCDVSGGTLQASNDGSTWSVPTSGSYYLYLRLHFASSVSPHTLQFYGRELSVSVPVMTSNTTPYGEAFGEAEQSGYGAFKVFDKSDSTGHMGQGTEHYTGYDFGKPVAIKMMQYYIAYYASAKIQYSDDKQSWNDASDVKTLQSEATQKGIINANLNGGHRYWRFFGSQNSSGAGTRFELQFYGLDYSEYDWDTDNPRHYLYDHGVEVEPLYWFTEAAGTVTSEKQGSQFVITDASTTYSGMFFTDSAVDFTSYAIMRRCYGNISENPTKSNMGVRNGKTVSASTIAGADAITSDIPYNLSLDVSAVSGSYYPYINAASNANTGKVSITEWWLE